MYKLTTENVADFTNWWYDNRYDRARHPKCTEEDVQEYFNLPKLKTVKK